MSFPPPYRSGSREWKTYNGIERAAARFGGKVMGFHDNALVIEWGERGTHNYPAEAGDCCTLIELQLKYDLEP